MVIAEKFRKVLVEKQLIFEKTIEIFNEIIAVKKELGLPIDKTFVYPSLISKMYESGGELFFERQEENDNLHCNRINNLKQEELEEMINEFIIL